MNETTEELQKELDKLYEIISSHDWMEEVTRIVEIELELESRCNK